MDIRNNENRTEHQIKILNAMTKVRENLIAFKKKMNSELVVSRDGKIVRIKPEDL